VALGAGSDRHRLRRAAARGRPAAGSSTTTKRSRSSARATAEVDGPCDATDLAKWSSLPITQARRALDVADPPGDADAWRTDDPLPCRLLAAFDTLMLGHRTRVPFVCAEADHHILKGGGMLKPVALHSGVATGT
jgi:DNA glycosylase AlkZ-like